MRVAYIVLFLHIASLATANLVSAHRRISAPKCALVAAVERLKTSKAVFTGRVIGMKEAEGIQAVRFSVSKSWKYVRASEVTVTNYVHREGPYFRQAKSYLVYAYLRKGALSTGGCSGTVEVEYASNDLSQLDKWQERNKCQRRSKS